MVTMGKAGLWTDSRYWTQAEQEMDCNWELHKEGKGAAWICSLCPGTQTTVSSECIRCRGTFKAKLGPYGKLGKFEVIPKL